MDIKDKNIKLEPSWLTVIGGEFEQPYMKSLHDFLQAEKAQGKIIYPPSSLWFNALNSTPFDKVKVVIIGQDPYHGDDNGKVQAHGLCFSVPKGVKPPPSLKNLFKELKRDKELNQDLNLGLALEIPTSGNLQSWADQGVLLLNAVLTVEQAQAASHQGRGWETFTDAIIKALNENCEHLVFLLWGAYAQKKGAFIDTEKHLVLTSPHPSPLSAHRGFLGNGHFSKTNHYLKQHQIKEIVWSVPRNKNREDV